MSKSAIVAIRMNPRVKHGAEKVFGELGLSPSQAVSLFYQQVRLHGGLPFAVKIPNARTMKAFSEAGKGEMDSFNSAAAMFEEAGIKDWIRDDATNTTRKAVQKGSASGRQKARAARGTGRGS